MKAISILCFLFLLPSAEAGSAPRPQQDSTVLLWPEGAPQAQGSEVTDKPALTLHFPAEAEATGAAVIVNPGGGYNILASDHEGLQVARWLNSIGVTAFVLRYRLKPVYPPSTALLDAMRAVRHVRHHADEYGISPNRIGMLGFSAGGHLASATGTHFDAGNSKSDDPVERMSSRPDFLVLVYAVINSDLFRQSRPDYVTTNTLVTANTPPTFLVQTHEDSGVSPNHSILFYQALLKEKIPAEMHIFGFGAHGLGLAPGDPDLVHWQPLLARWLRRSGFLADGTRTAVRGSVVLDGQPLFWGWVTLIPEDDHAPIARAYVHRQSTGEFEIDQMHGPFPGRHRVEIHVVSRDFSTPKAGSYSINNAEKYAHSAPGSFAPILVDIVPGEEIHLNFTTK
jgi:acetyl esterase/lipase